MERDGKTLPSIADKERPRIEDDDAPHLVFLPLICR